MGKLKLRFVAADDQTKRYLSESGHPKVLLDLTLKETKSWKSVLTYLQGKWSGVADLASRLSIFFVDSTKKSSVDMVSMLLNFPVGQSLSLHPAILKRKLESKGVRIDANENTESAEDCVVQMFYHLKPPATPSSPQPPNWTHGLSGKAAQPSQVPNSSDMHSAVLQDMLGANDSLFGAGGASGFKSNAGMSMHGMLDYNDSLMDAIKCVDATDFRAIATDSAQIQSAAASSHSIARPTGSDIGNEVRNTNSENEMSDHTANHSPNVDMNFSNWTSHHTEGDSGHESPPKARESDFSGQGLDRPPHGAYTSSSSRSGPLAGLGNGKRATEILFEGSFTHAARVSAIHPEHDAAPTMTLHHDCGSLQGTFFAVANGGTCSDITGSHFPRKDPTESTNEGNQARACTHEPPDADENMSLPAREAASNLLGEYGGSLLDFGGAEDTFTITSAGKARPESKVGVEAATEPYTAKCISENNDVHTVEQSGIEGAQVDTVHAPRPTAAALATVNKESPQTGMKGRTDLFVPSLEASKRQSPVSGAGMSKSGSGNFSSLFEEVTNGSYKSVSSNSNNSSSSIADARDGDRKQKRRADADAEADRVAKDRRTNLESTPINNRGAQEGDKRAGGGRWRGGGDGASVNVDADASAEGEGSTTAATESGMESDALDAPERKYIDLTRDSNHAGPPPHSQSVRGSHGCKAEAGTAGASPCGGSVNSDAYSSASAQASGDEVVCRYFVSLSDVMQHSQRQEQKAKQMHKRRRHVAARTKASACSGNYNAGGVKRKSDTTSAANTSGHTNRKSVAEGWEDPSPATYKNSPSPSPSPSPSTGAGPGLRPKASSQSPSGVSRTSSDSPFFAAQPPAQQKQHDKLHNEQQQQEQQHQQQQHQQHRTSEWKKQRPAMQRAQRKRRRRITPTFLAPITERDRFMQTCYL